MGLTEAQRLLIGYFKSIGMEEETIIITMVGLKNPDHAEQMIDFLIETKSRSPEEILEQMVLISHPERRQETK